MANFADILNAVRKFGEDRSISVISPIALTGSGALEDDPEITTSMATSRLIGRTTAGTGVMEEISAGDKLNLSSGSLNVNTSVVEDELVSPYVGIGT